MGTAIYREGIDPAAYQQLRALAGWKQLPDRQARAGIAGSEYTVSAMVGGHTVGMARLVGDGGYVAYIGDVIVHPDWRGRGIAKTMLSMITEYIQRNMQPGDKTFVCLLAAHGREPLYEALGFENRPNGTDGAGMSMWLEKTS